MSLELVVRNDAQDTRSAVEPRKQARATKFEQLYREYLLMEEEQAKQAERIGYVGHIFVHAALPYRRPLDDNNNELQFWIRSSNKAKLIIESGARPIDTGRVDRNGRPVHDVHRIGIPYGSFPRILLAYFASEVKIKGSPEIVLGNGVREWFSKMGIPCTGGKNGTIHAVRTQLERLMNCKISVFVNGEQPCEGQFLLAEGQKHAHSAWWNNAEGQLALWQPRILLSPTFFENLKNRAVPVNLRAMNALSQSPLAMDLFVWLSYRSDIRRVEPLVVPWAALWYQFGSDSAMNKFQENVRRALLRVQTVYPNLVVKSTRNGLALLAYPAAVRRLA